MKKAILISVLFVAGLIIEVSAQGNRPYHMRKNNRYGNFGVGVEKSDKTQRNYSMHKHNLWRLNEDSNQKPQDKSYRMKKHNLSGKFGQQHGNAKYHLRKHHLKQNTLD
ncbi:MAG: hypothetical protein ACNS62_17365 [Candidatus Cyclobacteriaceae bacterium M3_2C_046]